MPKVSIDSDFERDSRRNILRIKGENAFLRLILLAGGVMSAPEASDLLGIEAREIRALREQGKLIALVLMEMTPTTIRSFNFHVEETKSALL